MIFLRYFIHFYDICEVTYSQLQASCPYPPPIPHPEVVLSSNPLMPSTIIFMTTTVKRHYFAFINATFLYLILLRTLFVLYIFPIFHLDFYTSYKTFTGVNKINSYNLRFSHFQSISKFLSFQFIFIRSLAIRNVAISNGAHLQ